MDLEESRDVIKKIDEQIAGLFVERMEAVRNIAACKNERGLPVEDVEQEALVFAERGALVEDEELRPFYLQFLRSTLDVSKRWQCHLMYGDGRAEADEQEPGNAPEDLLS